MFLFAIFGVSGVLAQQAAVPTINGDAGPCSVEFTVTDASGKPVYNAQIRVHFDYGFLGIHQLDLQAATNTHGKVRFTGLPDSTDGALIFHASTDALKGMAVDDPNTECHAKHGIFMAPQGSIAKADE